MPSYLLWGFEQGKVTQKFLQSMLRVKDIFSKLNGAKYFQHSISTLGTITYPLMKTLLLKQPLYLLLENMST